MSRTINQALTDAGFRYVMVDGAVGYWSFRFGRFELAIEPLLFDAGDYALAVYRGRELALETKVQIDVKGQAELVIVPELGFGFGRESSDRRPKFQVKWNPRDQRDSA